MTLRDRDGHLCCGGQDCKQVEAVVLPNGNYFLRHVRAVAANVFPRRGRNQLGRVLIKRLADCPLATATREVWGKSNLCINTRRYGISPLGRFNTVRNPRCAAPRSTSCGCRAAGRQFMPAWWVLLSDSRCLVIALRGA